MWTEPEKGLIMAAYFIGYFITQVGKILNQFLLAKQNKFKSLKSKINWTSGQVVTMKGEIRSYFGKTNLCNLSSSRNQLSLAIRSLRLFNEGVQAVRVPFTWDWTDLTKSTIKPVQSLPTHLECLQSSWMKF